MKERFVVVGVAAFVVVAWLVWASHSHWLAHFFNGSAETTSAGSWGDSFGAFNGLFTALGFAAVFMTLRMQGRALKEQQADQHRQRFEATFFHLLQLLRELRDELSYKSSKELYRDVDGNLDMNERKGLSAVRGALFEFRHWRVLEEVGGVLSREELAALYEARVHSRAEAHFAPYFRIIYSILRLIRDDRFLTQEEKVTFGNLLRSQLTSDEVELTAFDALMSAANDFSELLVHFRMLKYLPADSSREVLERYYDQSAFLGRVSG